MDKNSDNKKTSLTKNGNGNGNGMVHKVHVDGMYENWFLDYASYVILERAVPVVYDGLKPVQRRILFSMKELDDGRFNKVANIIGHTMQYHPHGDAAIGDAIVNLGQKDLMIETQGNWGDLRTGDGAAAPRYIEARLSKFALDVAFNNNTTEWQLSYDGRKKEPINLPIKFPLILAQGAEGIAVGLATKIMPHNFNEIIKASINVLKGKKTNLLPDFPTGGMADFSNYNEGVKGSKIRIRAKIETIDKRKLIIRDIPFTSNTTHLIDSIVKANENKKIKIQRVTDNTAKNIEIVVELPAGVSPDVTIDALYAFTDCEISISPNTCIIINDKPHFISVNEALKLSTDNTVELLKKELEIKKDELSEKYHFASLEKIFIENRIYHDIEECETWESVIETIDKGLKPFKDKLMRDVTTEDIEKLTEIKIKRITKFDSIKADKEIKRLSGELKEVKRNLSHLVHYAISYFQGLLEKYGKERQRKTEIKTFDTIQVTRVAVANRKLYINRKEGFVGYGLKKDELIAECSDLDNVIVFRKDGKFSVTKVTDKSFVGKNIIHAAVWKKSDDRMVYNMVYMDSKTKKSFVKRFSVTSITRDKEYDLTKGNNGSRVIYFTANPNSESEIVNIQLSDNCTARNKFFEYDFDTLAIKGRGANGNILTKYPIKRIERKSIGISSLGGRDIWLDETVGRLNTEERGKYLGNFNTNDHILVIFNEGSYSLTTFELINRYEMDEIVVIEKFNPNVIITAVYYDGKKAAHFVKRFQIETTTTGQRFMFISETKNSKLVIATINHYPGIEFKYEKGKKKGKITGKLDLGKFIEVKGRKARGNKLNYQKITNIKLLELAAPAGMPEVEETSDMAEEEKLTKQNLIKGNEEKGKKLKKKHKPEPAPVKDKLKKSNGNSFKIGDTVELDITNAAKKKKSDKAEQIDLF